jgi:hypothetical protein
MLYSFERYEMSYHSVKISYFFIPVYVYFSLFNYYYAGRWYDFICEPLIGIILEYFEEMRCRVEKERNRVKMGNEKGEKIKSNEGFFEGVLVNVFKIDNILLMN